MNDHLSPQEILAYIDGELSKTETQRAEKHLHSCWTCLTDVERLKADIATILDAHSESFAPALPRPPHPWPSFQSVLARRLPEKPTPLRVRIAVYLNSLTLARPFLIAGAVGVLLVGGYVLFHAKAVSAKEVLRRMQVADAQRSAITKDQVIRERVHIRRTSRSRAQAESVSLDTWKSPTAAYWDIAKGDSAAADLKAEYQAHAIPAGLPLSAAAVDSLGKAAGGSPTISHRGSDVDVNFSGTKSSAPDSVERVSLIVQPDTWQVKQMTLDFPDESFEVTEDDYSVMPASEAPADVLAYLEPAIPPAALPPPALPRASSAALGAIHLPMVNLDKAELKVFATLHSLGADLGEPVTVAHSDRGIEVGIWEEPLQRRNELEAALADQPGVQLQTTVPRVPQRNAVDAQTAIPSPAANGTPLQIEAGSSDDDQRLLKFFGSADKEEGFTNQALATSTAILSHLFALRNLQAQFPVERSQLLAPEEQAQLRSLLQDHTTAISTGLNSLGEQLAPLDATFHLGPCIPVAPPAIANWQEGSLEALETAQETDGLLRAMLTTTEAPAAPDSALPQISQNLCRLRLELTNLNATIR